MMGLFVFRERLRDFYGKFSMYINPVIHFLFGLAAVIILNSNLGFMVKLTSPVVVLVIALVCSFLPYSVISLVVAFLTLIHCSVLPWRSP